MVHTNHLTQSLTPLADPSRLYSPLRLLSCTRDSKTGPYLPLGLFHDVVSLPLLLPDGVEVELHGQRLHLGDVARLHTAQVPLRKTDENAGKSTATTHGLHMQDLSYVHGLCKCAIPPLIHAPHELPQFYSCSYHQND